MKQLAWMSSCFWKPQLRALVLIVALLATIALPGAVAASPTSLQSGPTTQDYELRISVGSGRDAVVAEVGVLAGNPNIFVSPTSGISRVRYYVDPPADSIETLTAAKEPFVVADQPPFRLSHQGRFDTGSLPDGPHTIVAVIDLTDGRTMVKTARVHVHNGGPALLFDAMPLQATLGPGGRTERALQIMTNQGGLVRYSVESDAPWLRLKSQSPIGNPKEGVAPGSHIIEFNTLDLAPGEYTATLTATAEGFAPATVTANLVVLAPDADCSPLDCTQVRVAAPYTLDFNQDHGFLSDANGVGTGLPG